MADTIDEEGEAIKTVLRTLESLPPDVRIYVIEYVLRRLQISIGSVRPTEVASPSQLPTALASRPDESHVAIDESKPTHIKELKETKKPRSANEMAALVAYFMENVAPADERKDKITTNDVIQFFKIAGFPLPKEPRVTLANAKAAGYFDAVGDGEYKLNAVGHNLVVHSMPRGLGSQVASKRKPAKKAKSAKTKKARRPKTRKTRSAQKSR